jgi:hypothetical protein
MLTRVWPDNTRNCSLCYSTKLLTPKLPRGRIPLTLIKDRGRANQRLVISLPFLTVRQTASSSLGAVYSTLDDFSSRVPDAHLPCEKSCRNLQSYIECVSLHRVRIWVYAHYPCVGSDFGSPRPRCSICRHTNGTVECDSRYCTIVRNVMAPNADGGTYLEDDRGAVSGRSCGGASASLKFARLLVWMRWYCRESDWGG